MDTELSIEIDLGADSDCDTCGCSYNNLTYRYYLTSGQHVALTRVGCYGGDSAEGAAAVLDLLRHALGWAECGRDDITALIGWVTKTEQAGI